MNNSQPVACFCEKTVVDYILKLCVLKKTCNFESKYTNDNEMLRYNTQLKTLVLPEYGRNIQSMVDHCLTIEDRDERTRCAYTIVASMANLFPELKTGEGYNHKLWDHLAIMSDFQLDIDYPCEVIRRDNLQTKPEPVGYKTTELRRRHYGRAIESMVIKASDMPEGEERDELIRLVANQMKKQLIAVNKDGATDQRVFRDMAEISSGRIIIDAEALKLHDYIIPVLATGKKKKKK